MGLLIGIMRRQQLTMMRSTLSWQLMLIANAMSQATEANKQLMAVGTDYESDSMLSKKLQQRQYKFKLLEEKLALQKEDITTRLQAVETELKSVNEMIQNAISEVFTYKAA